MKQIIIYNLFFASFGTILGGILGCFAFTKTPKQIGYLLGYTAGIMLGLVCIDILPSIISEYSLFKIIIFLILGAVLTYLIDKTVQEKIDISLNNSLKLTGILMFIGLCLHNIPEGIALSSSLIFNQKMGIRVGIVMTLHDIPEGLAISAPLSAGGTKKLKALGFSFASILFTICGVFIGMFAYKIMNDLIYASLALASGAIIYIIYQDLIPQSLNYINDTQLTVMIIVGLVTSLIIISI
ncbi:MAG TPA: ZIP family metal transporter [Bacilli bacterium]|nr:ZIP family metal transporter [Bacilli bacterium]HQA19687.1 ZIP family metal transporter [Bacilli bacterium]HQD92560.1 ZIP family metal transporter [Bacilli bacterium]